MLKELWDAFCEWAESAWNWLKNFISKVWEVIVSWYEVLCETIEDWLHDDDDEVVLVDGGTQFGRDLYEKIKKENPTVESFSKYRRTEALKFNSRTGELKKVSNFEANRVENDDDLAKDIRSSNGILRLNK